MNTTVIGVGSNINPSQNIQLARQRINVHHKILKESQFIQTKPVGFSDQPDFTNGVILIVTHMELNDLKDWLKSIEKELGRKRSPNKFGPRTIDLDVLIWNDKIIDEDVYLRDFLKDAIRQICPNIAIEL